MATISGPKRVGCSTRPKEFDVYAHREIREAFSALEAKHKRLLESLHDMTFVVTQDGKLMSVNQAGVQMFGYESKEQMLLLDSVTHLYNDPSDHGLLQQRIQASHG